MPRLDGTGPLGLGPRTGWGRGFCGMNLSWRRGFGRRGFGFGRGFGRMFGGWFDNWFGGRNYLTKKEESEVLAEEAEILKEELKAIEERLAELKKTS